MELSYYNEHTSSFSCEYCGSLIETQEVIILHQHNSLQEGGVYKVHRDCVWKFIKSHKSSWSIIFPEAKVDEEL